MADTDRTDQTTAPSGAPQSEEKLYNIDEASTRLALARAQIYRCVADGKLNGEKRGRALLFAESELARYERETDERETHLRDALRGATALFSERLNGRSQLGTPPDLPETIDAQLAELGRLILRDALLEGVPDLYFDPLHDGMRLLAGQEGNRREITRFPAALAERLMTWATQLATLPAEGSIRQALGRHTCDETVYQFRLTAVPTLLGQLLHLHFFLEGDAGGLTELGYLPAQTALLEPILSGRPGLVLVAGAPGPSSDRHQRGLAHWLSSDGRLVVCLQRSIQFRDDALVQLDLNGQNDFAALWRTALDMRPNAIIVEDVTDSDQVRALIQGAGAGTLIIACVNASSVREALVRLLDGPVDQIDFSRTLLGAVELTALRRLCPHCRQTGETTEQAAALVGSDISLVEANGCSHCGDGYLGYRTACGVWTSTALQAWLAQGKDAPLIASDNAISLAASVHQAVVEGEAHWSEAQTYLTTATQPK